MRYTLCDTISQRHCEIGVVISNWAARVSKSSQPASASFYWWWGFPKLTTPSFELKGSFMPNASCYVQEIAGMY